MADSSKQKRKKNSNSTYVTIYFSALKVYVLQYFMLTNVTIQIAT